MIWELIGAPLKKQPIAITSKFYFSSMKKNEIDYQVLTH